jgi:hypothetical protein
MNWIASALTLPGCAGALQRAHVRGSPKDEPMVHRCFSISRRASCGFVNLGPTLALCEKGHSLLPVTFCCGSVSLLRRGIGRFSGTQLEFSKPLGFVLAVNEATLETE